MIEVEKINMIYDVQNINFQLEKYLKLNKQLQYLENNIDESNLIKIENLRHEFILTETKINLIKPNFENPEKMKHQFSGCAFVTFKTQKMLNLVKKYSKKKFFFKNINNEGYFVKNDKELLNFKIKNSPEPTDIIWENFEKNHNKWKWFIISMFFSLIANIIFLFLIKHIKTLHTKKLSNKSSNVLINLGIL